MNQVKTILREFSEKPIAYQPIYSKITGGITTGILLSQLVYWHFAVKETEFYKTDREFCEELAIGLWELKAAKKKLKELGIIKIKKAGMPAKTYYKINIDKVINLIASWWKNHQQVGGKTTNKLVEKPPTNNNKEYTENTTENTTLQSPKNGDCEEDKIPNLLEDNKKHIQIIGLYAKAKKINFESREQQESFIKRNLRAARLLTPYPHKRIINTMDYLIKNADFKWTLETAGKFIDEDLNALQITGKKDDEIIKSILEK